MSGRARWSIGAAVFVSSYLAGYLLSRVPTAGDLGGVVAVVGMGVLSWLVPVLLRKRPTAAEREAERNAERERRRAERLQALTAGRAGYGQLRDLVVRVNNLPRDYFYDDGVDTSAFLWKVERDGISDVVSAAPGSAKVGGYGQQYSYTEFHLRMKPGRSAGASAQETGERAEADRPEPGAARGAA